MAVPAMIVRAWPQLVLHVLLPLIVISVGVSVVLAVSHFPTEYDLRYRWFSALASARDNPQGFYFLGAGLICAGLLSVPVLGFASRRSAVTPPRFLIELLAHFGALGLCLLGVEAIFFPNPGASRPFHQAVAQASLVAYALSFGGLVWLTARDMADAPLRRLYLAVTSLLLATPLVATPICNFVWYLTKADPALFGSDHPKRLPLVLLSTAFWEWVLIVDLLAVLYMTVWISARLRAGP